MSWKHFYLEAIKQPSKWTYSLLYNHSFAVVLYLHVLHSPSKTKHQQQWSELTFTLYSLNEHLKFSVSICYGTVSFHTETFHPSRKIFKQEGKQPEITRGSYFPVFGCINNQYQEVKPLMKKIVGTITKLFQSIHFSLKHAVY